MSKLFVLGVDIGTQGTKAALFTPEGRCLATAFCRSDLYTPAEGIVEEDPEKQVASVCRTIKQCVKQSGVTSSVIGAIGIDGQMAGVIGVGKSGWNVTCYDSWLDTRCGGYIGRMEKKAGEEIIHKTGNAPSFNHGPKILWWKGERKSVFKQIHAFVQPSGYAAMRLCGLDGRGAFIDRTYLHFSGFADNRNNRWDTGLCKTFQVSQAKLPAIVEPEQVVGELTAGMARRCGLKAGVPVVAGCGDTAASFLACGATREGICVDVAGTASVFAATTKAFKADQKYRSVGCGQAATKGLWHPYAYINGGGMNLEWFRKEIANRGKQAGEITFAKLNRLAEKVMDEDSPLFVPHLAGRVCPSQPNLRGSWVDLKWSHSLGHLYKAVLEGVALEYGIYAGILREQYQGMSLREIRITGGGEKSKVWNQLKANVLQMPVVQLTRSEGAPMGAALVAGFGVGMFSSLDAAAKRWVDKAARIRPDKKQDEFYRARVKKYTELIRVLNDISESH
jgi:xylulokinase